MFNEKLKSQVGVARGVEAARSGPDSFLSSLIALCRPRK